MIAATIDDAVFMKDMKNIFDYSLGFLEGVKNGRRPFLDSLGKSSIEVLKNYVDTSARMNPAMLQHVYEWNQNGGPAGRLFDITYTISNQGLSIQSSFTQSSSVKNDSKVPFWNKARIMENGVPITIRPINAKVLSFKSKDGSQVFTQNEVHVRNPGGTEAQNGYQKTFDIFFNNYFSQSFLKSSGILDHLQSPIAFKVNLPAGKKGGRSVGVRIGYKWMSEAGI